MAANRPLSAEKRPVKPTATLSNAATDRQARQHYSMMLDYWVAEAKWQELQSQALAAKCQEIAQANTDLAGSLHRIMDEAKRLQADLDLLARSGCRVREHDGHRFVEIASDPQP